ncbi:adenylate/guanylate cyclase domain-containing protein [Salegentibacter sediminis]|uniref:adenylate/guanylate cyclase domain-containing protein n=1 Tax=Salegentibacter sediminis TaxID=1930251 RepID=UPI0009C01D56|nr:adenylate/guanylate cyclase domain-containing protein [Salegentibacter sediminis]
MTINYPISFNINEQQLLKKTLRQLAFWGIAYSLLFFTIHLHTISIFEIFLADLESSAATLPLIVMFSVLLFSPFLGLVDILLEKDKFKNYSLGLNALTAGALYTGLLMGAISLVRLYLLSFGRNNFLNEISLNLLTQHWNYYFMILGVHTGFMSLIIGFVNQLSKRFGPGMLLPFFSGKYKYPREEERIFMFLDLSCSTKLAEQLGHIKYSALIKDSFLDIDKMVKKYNAEVYQYVGDEVVLSWPVEKAKNLEYIDFFCGVEELFREKQDYYINNYNIAPVFKAGVHLGKVTAVEVGDLKKDIAYHGDTLNVAARLEGLCKVHSQPLLISEAVYNLNDVEKRYYSTSLGAQYLKGRSNPVEVFSITRSLRKVAAA